MATKPTTLTPWATTLAAYPISGLNNRIQPPVGWQTGGWDENEEPPPNYENWMKWEGYSWDSWFSAALARGATKVVVSSDSDDHQGDYDCDGTDDDVQIQSAIDAVAAMGTGGGLVLLSRGTFTVEAKITMDDSVVLMGSGPGTIIQVAAGAATDFNVIEIDGKDKAVVKNLTIDGNIAGGHGHFHAGIVVKGASTSAVVEKVWLENFDENAGTYGYGVEITGTATRTKVINSEFLNCQARGVVSISTATLQLSLISGNFFKDCQEAIGVWNSPAVSVLGNTIYNCTAGAISLGYSGVGTKPSDTTVRGNMIYTSGNSAIYMTGTTLDVSGNTIVDTAGHGIWAVGADRSLIGGNTIRDAENHGILLDTCDDTLIQGNGIFDVSQDATNVDSGIYIDGGLRCTVTGNRFRNSGATVSRYSIEGAAGGTGNATVYGNDCRANSGSGEINDGGSDMRSSPIYVWDGAAHQTDNQAAINYCNRVN